MSELLSDYDYDLPTGLIAQTPLHPRGSSRLLVLHRKERRWEHRQFRDLPDYLDSKDLLVANNTSVIKARLLGYRIRLENGVPQKGGKVEFVLLEEVEPLVWEGLFHASAKYLPGLKFEIPTPDGQALQGELIRGSAESPSGTVVAKFNRNPLESGAGEIPLPHYIERGPNSEDLVDYQTVYAKAAGSAAAPTAGLHFTPELLAELKGKGIHWEELTLHVGLGTFRPVKNEVISQHVMHQERFEVSTSSAAHISKWKNSGKRVVAVGTTSVRTLEAAWDAQLSGVRSGQGRTALFIRPGHFHFQVVDRLLTNFHLPKSTLLMLVSAFADREFVLAAYREAVKEKYRFFSYGDAMLVL
jgi:S-adenosylmethionine:tRNA ribosyltransferase-isomerase